MAVKVQQCSPAFFNPILAFQAGGHVRNHGLASDPIDATDIYPNSKCVIAGEPQPHCLPFYSMRNISVSTEKTLSFNPS